MSSKHLIALKISAVLWVIWGLVHAFGGIMTLAVDTSAGFQGIAAGVDPALLQHDYHPAVGGILKQHGWNLLWAGASTIVGGVFIWRANATAIWVTALIGGLFDIGYFVFVDLPGFGTFVPGTVMTIFSASAILLSFWAWRTMRQAQ